MSGNPWNKPHLSFESDRPSIDPSKISILGMRFCPYTERAILTLLTKNIPFQVIFINLTEKPAWFVKETRGSVPVLYHDNNIILDSLVICDYLDEMYPNPQLHPGSPIQKAKDRNLLEFFNRGVAFLYKILSSVYKPQEVTHTPEDRRDLFSSLVEEFTGLEGEMEKRGTDFLGGKTPAMIDYMIFPQFERLEMLPLVFPGEHLGVPSSLPHLTAWFTRMAALPAVARYRLEPEDLAKWHEGYRRGKVEYDFLVTASEDPQHTVQMVSTDQPKSIRLWEKQKLMM